MERNFTTWPVWAADNKIRRQQKFYSLSKQTDSTFRVKALRRELVCVCGGGGGSGKARVFLYK